MRFRPARRAGTRTTARVAAVLSAALVAGLLQALPGPQAVAETNLPAASWKEKSVKGTNAAVKPRPADKTVSTPRAPKAAWPKEGTASVAVPASGGSALSAKTSGGSGREVRAGSLPVSLAAAPRGPLAPHQQAAPPYAVRDTAATVRVLDRKTAQKAGVNGVLLTVASNGSAAKVKVSVDYDAFADAAGAGYGERLRLVQLPACVLTTPSKPECRTAIPLAGRNDAEKHTVTADAVTVADITTSASKSAAPAVGSQALAGGATVLAATAGSASPAGDYKASPLSAASTWSTALNSGSFSWSYNMPVPSVPMGLAPTVGLAYSSGAIDGRTSNSNNQASWAGDGFSIAPGYIERSYKPCAEDGVKTDGQQPGDLCWAYDNATISFDGHAGELIPINDEEWRIKGDDNTRVFHWRQSDRGNGDNDGEYFRATTANGTRYYFGYNRLTNWTAGKPETKSVETVPVFGNNSGEPCNKAAFADSWCQQGRRWNLDLVIDSSGNDITYWYNQEANTYGRNLKDTDGTPYVRASVLDHIEYGQQLKDLYSDTVKPMARVDFTTAERCLETDTALCDPAKIDTNRQYWYDTPWDQNCNSGSKCDMGRLSPTFWGRTRLSNVTTKTLQSDGNYKPVDSWDLHHKWGTADFDYQLLLDSIKHTGLAGATPVPLPATTLSYSAQVGRLDKSGDGRPGFYKQRLRTVLDESGGQLDVNYSQAACSWDSLPSAQSNTSRCFPQMYQAGFTDPVTTEWFNKYVVDSVISSDRTGGALSTQTNYTYYDGGAWAFDDTEGITKEKLKTWSQWRGYGKVRVQTGSSQAMSTQADHYFLRGMNGDRTDPADKTKTRSVTVPDGEGNDLTDDEAWAAYEYRSETFDRPGGKILAKTVNTPWKKQTAKRERDWGTTTANLTGTSRSRNFTYLDAAGKWRETRVNTTLDDLGRAPKVEDLGDTDVTGDEKCTRTTYADDEWIRAAAIHTETIAADCAANPDRDTRADGTSVILSDTRTRYDGQAYGAAPVKGLVTMTETLKSRSGNSATYLDDTSSYDAYGRPLTTTALASSSVFDLNDTAKAPVTTPAVSPRSTTTVYTPATGRPTKAAVTTPPATVGNAATAQTSTSYLEPLRGLPYISTDANNLRTDIEYDALGRPLKVWKPNRSKQNNQSPNLQFRYTNAENTIQSVATLTLNNDGSADTSYTLYDGLGRVRQTQAPGPDGGRLLTDTFYDERGQVRLAYSPYHNTAAPSGTLFTVVDADGIETQTATEYDGLGRPTKSTLLSGNGTGTPLATTTTVYGGDRVTVTPPKGATPTTTVSDASGRTTELREYQATNPAGPTGPYDSTTYRYDPAGHMTGMTGPQGAQWSWTYDQLGRQTKAVDPDSGTTAKAYNDRGELTTTTDGRGKTITSVYDNLSRLLETHDGTATGPLLTSQSWDKVKGQVASSTRHVNIGGTVYPYTTTINTYDALYRPTKTTLTVPSVPGQEALAGDYATGSSYNPDGTVQATSYPAAGSLPAEVVAFTYNKLHQTTAAGSNLSTYLTGQTYTLTGKPYRSTLNAGGVNTTITNGYEQGTQRLSVSRTDTDNTAVPARANAYKYDEAGNVTELSDVSRTGTDRQCFQYDYLTRLTEAFTPTDPTCPATPDGSKLGGPAPYWSSYTYNTDGTRKTETQHNTTGDTSKDQTRTYTYPTAGAAHPHSLLSTSTTTGTTGPVTDTYDYDQVGNTTRRTLNPSAAPTSDQTLSWDSEGHLHAVADTVQTKTANSTVTTKKATDYVYDPSGNRLLGHTLDTANLADENTTLYLGATELKLTKGAAKPTATRYYPLGAATAVRTDDNKVTFQVTDHHGTADTSINATDGTATQRRMTPFGQERGTPPAAWAGTKGFVGGINDTQTGLTHLGAREYDPATGRFISVDPLLETNDPQSHNGYVYAHNNPVTGSDPSGLRDGDCDEGADCYGGRVITKKHPRPSAAEPQSEDKPSVNDVVFTDPNGADIKLPKNDWDFRRRYIKAYEREIKWYDPNDAEERWITQVSAMLSACTAEKGNCDDIAFYVRQFHEANLKAGLYTGSDARVGGIGIGGTGELGSAGARGWGSKKTSPCRPHSFPTDTEVLMADGTHKAIEDIAVGDIVATTDTSSGKTVDKPVVAKISTEGDKNFTELTLHSGETSSRIVATDTHPFWVPDLKRWVQASDLKPGQLLRTSSGAYIQIFAVKHFTQKQRTNDLTVGDIHAYYVLSGATPVLVHNCSVSPHELERTEQLGGARDREQVDQIAESMTRDGWVGEPIEVYEHLGRRYVINGHHRLAAAKKAGIDVQYRSLTLDEVKAYKYKSADEVVWASIEVGGDFPEERRGRRRR
ncbi:RHS repeat-associated core domain-containing protein [Streptomyces sp. TLI_146]|uniref:RHS repeat-associated core domain-containing protein n=1 Tax=Streptomyces sp. TLI_146 TaxID=1938858 RepID=UPI000C70F09C|nr:RHS repeat-associated core domain-containing protein [Streptomyces sp. TLI_146]PKV77095.1 intein/RHS repeat-associated protein [Streptomyces sp. TLI_146]